MTSPMEVGFKPENSPQNLLRPYEDATNFNRDVRNEIEKQKSRENSVVFRDSNKLVGKLREPAILLHILLKISYPNCTMDQTACDDHLADRWELFSTLNSAYITGEFANVMVNNTVPSLDNILNPASAISSGISPSNGQSTFHAAFKQRYRGNTAKLFVETLNKERRAYRNDAAAQTPYNWSISVVQSSGMGKSRMVDEAGRMVFTFPINLREETVKGNLAYPPEDINMRQFFMERRDIPDQEQQADYAILLRELFIKARDLVQTKFPEKIGPELAHAWSEYLEEGQTDTLVGVNRREFYDKVVQNVTEAVKEKGQTLDTLEESLQRSCKGLLDLIHSDQAPNDNACFVYFDEAHTLTRPKEESTGDKQERSPFHNLGTVLSKLVNYQVFFIFISTSTRLAGLAPPPSSYPSDRATQGSKLIPPFTELPFDVYEEEVVKSLGSLTLQSAGEMNTMIKFGRPMWYAHRNARPRVDVFGFAMDKLCRSGVDKYSTNSALAALGVRVGLAFDETHGYSVQSDLVESHLRVVYSIPQHRTFMHTGAPSEPVVAEAAGRYFYSNSQRGIAAEGPKWLLYALEKGFLAHGERLELAGRLLLTSAHDIALRNIYGEYERISNKPAFHRPIPVLDFLDALFHNQHHGTIRAAKGVTGREDVKTLAEAFSGAYVFFSHFALAEDSEMLSTPALATALVRGMALHVKDGQESIDTIIPIHMGPLTAPISPKTTSAINLQFKNRKGALNCPIDRSITVPEVEMPTISIIFEFGIKGNQADSIEVLNQSHRVTRSKQDEPHQDDRHYEIVARDCSSAIFGTILPEMDSQYQAILGTGTFLEDFSRCDDPANVAALQAQKPAFSGKRQNKLYEEWSLNTDEIGSRSAKPDLDSSGRE